MLLTFTHVDACTFSSFILTAIVAFTVRTSTIIRNFGTQSGKGHANSLLRPSENWGFHAYSNQLLILHFSDDNTAGQQTVPISGVGGICVDGMVWTASANQLDLSILLLSSFIPALNSVIKFIKRLLNTYCVPNKPGPGDMETHCDRWPCLQGAWLRWEMTEIYAESSLCCVKCSDRVNTGHQKVPEAEPWIQPPVLSEQGKMGAQGQREDPPWESFTEIPPRFKSADSFQNISVRTINSARIYLSQSIMSFKERPALSSILDRLHAY